MLASFGVFVDVNEFEFLKFLERPRDGAFINIQILGNCSDTWPRHPLRSIASISQIDIDVQVGARELPYRARRDQRAWDTEDPDLRRLCFVIR